MEEQEKTRTRLIDSAIKLFRRQGYDGTGLTQILNDSGAPKGSFYYHFPEGKEQLADETIRRAGANVATLVDNCFNECDSFEKGVLTASSTIAAWFKKSGYAEGCPVSSILLGTMSSSDTLRKSSELVLKSWCDVIAKHARRHGFDSQSAELGEAMILGLEGAWVLSRATQSIKPFEVAAAMVLAMIRK